MPARPTRRPLASLLALATAAAWSAASLTAGTAARAQDGPTVVRVAGPDRVTTAVEVARAVFPSATTAVLATSRDFADALAGTPLAASLHAPLLLVDPNGVDAALADELARLGVQDVVLLGGPAAIPATVAQQLQERGLGVERIAGTDRFATAVEVAEALVEIAGVPASDDVVVAVGQAADPGAAWPDALSAGTLAGATGAPIVLVRRDAVPTATAAFLAERDPARVRVVGGPAAVSEATARELGAGRTVQRLSGDDRFATAAAVATAATADQPGGTAGTATVVVASGRTFADALSAGAAAAALDGVLLLADPVALERSPALLDWLGALDPEQPPRVVVVGGPAALSPGTDGELRRALGLPAPALRWEPVGTFDTPLGLVGVPGDERRFVIERGGRVVALAPDGSTTTVLDLTARVGPRGDTGRLVGEHGLLGIALHPTFATSGRLFVHFSDLAGDTRVEEHVLAPGAARVDPAAIPRLLLQVDQPESNHNGGTIAFARDGRLLVFLGDGGGARDPDGNGQDPTTRLGAILRLDVDTPDTVVPADNPYVGGGGDPLVWAIGVRNPYRSSVDRLTGDVWVADVGQGAWEEVDLLTHPGGAGANLGWNVAEGDHCHPETVTSCDRSGFVAPVLEYGHDEGQSITGGYVHRGDIGELRGHYVYGDFVRGFIRTAVVDDDGRVVEETSGLEDLGFDGNVFSFGEDGTGNTYVMNATTVFRLGVAD